MKYAEQDKKERFTFTAKNYVFESTKDLSDGLVITPIVFYDGDDHPDKLVEDTLLFMNYYMTTHYPMIDEFVGFDKIDVTVIPF